MLWRPHWMVAVRIVLLLPLSEQLWQPWLQQSLMKLFPQEIYQEIHQIKESNCSRI